MVFTIKRIIKKLQNLSDFTPLAIFWVLKAFLYDWLASKYSFAELPKIALSMGLEHKKSNNLNKFGELKGDINGFKVYVHPDSSVNPIVRINYPKKYPDFEFSTSKPLLEAKIHITNFDTQNKRFNKIFKTKRANRKIADDLGKNEKLIELFNAFYTKWILKLDGLTFANNEIYCRLSYGFNIFPYIPPAILKKIIKDLLIIAEEINATFINVADESKIKATRLEEALI